VPEKHDPHSAEVASDEVVDAILVVKFKQMVPIRAESFRGISTW